MARNIKVSENHGINPGMLLCPLCGTETGVALHGRLPGDAEAPRYSYDREPCGDCREQLAAGNIFFIEAVSTAKGPERTGRMVCVRREAVIRTMAGENLDKLLEQGVGMMRPPQFQQMFGKHLEAKDADGN